MKHDNNESKHIDISKLIKKSLFMLSYLNLCQSISRFISCIISRNALPRRNVTAGATENACMFRGMKRILPVA
jgi:hypothetical protein